MLKQHAQAYFNIGYCDSPVQFNMAHLFIQMISGTQRAEEIEMVFLTIKFHSWQK